MFKKRAEVVAKAVRAIGVEVVVNAEKPRKGAFVLTIERNGERSTHLELLDMPRPFTKLKAVDFDAVAEELVKAFSA